MGTSPLIGSWHLIWLELPGPDGVLWRVTDAKGSLIYTPGGQVSVQVMYANVSDTPPSGPLQYAQSGYEGSFGQYLVDESTRTVTHRYDGANVRSLLGQDVPRRYELTRSAARHPLHAAGRALVGDVGALISAAAPTRTTRPETAT